MPATSLQRPSRRAQQGQALPLAAIMMTGLLAAAAVGIDAGRVVSEKRFLQNVVDAAALAGAAALAEGKPLADVEADVRAVFALNAAANPNGRPPAAPAALPVYADGHSGSPQHLVDGVLVTNEEVRVATRNDVDFTFGRAIGLSSTQVPAAARAAPHGGLLPISAREFLQAPGPEVGAAAPCVHDERRFMAIFATADTACLGSTTDATGRNDPEPGLDFDPLNPNNDPARHGPIIAILGTGASPQNAADFRGFVVLDIRNFSTTTSQVYYNGAGEMNENQLKDLEADWILAKGYPGPPFPPVVTPPSADNQIAILSGSSSGVAVEAVAARYQPGDEILVSVYPGYVMAIPDFAITNVPAISLPVTGTVANAGSFRVTRNQAFNGYVTLSTVADTLDPDNPLNLGTLTSSPPITYQPNPVMPSLGGGTRVDLTNIATSNATPGIYALWIKGEAGSPYMTAKTVPLTIEVGDVTRDFSIVADSTGKVATTAGDTVTFTLTLTNHPHKNTDFGGTVALSVDTPWPTGTGGITFSSSTVTPSRNGTTVTLSINSGSLAQGIHRFVVRATGMNGDPLPRKVTHLLPLEVNVAPNTTPGHSEYIDMTGFAVMRITGYDSNTVWAYAITPVIADPNDPRLRRGRNPRLLPW